MENTIQFGILVGSARKNSNSYGIAKWVNNQLEELLKSSKLNAFQYNISIVDPLTKPHPVHPIVNEIPYFIKDTSAYSSEEVREWSSFIKACNAVIIVTPEYNSTIPSTLKLALDVLLFEWNNKPATAITFGSQGGNKADDSLRQILNCLKVNVTDERVQIKLPMEVIMSGKRVDANDSFLMEYKDDLNLALNQLINKIESQVNAAGAANDVTN